MRKVALVTGASSGIGLELAKILAAKGHDLVIVSRDKAQLNDVKTVLHEVNDIDVWAFAHDLSEIKGVEKLIDEIAHEKLEVEILCNNAGFGDFAEFKDADWNKLQSMINLNMTSVSKLTHEYLPAMLKHNRGRILNTASVASFIPGPFMAVYYATKAYVLSFSEAIAEEIESTNVTVTALCPGPTTSGFQKTSNMGNSPLVKGRKLPSSAEVAQYGYDSMMSGKRVAIHGYRTKFMVYISRIIPRSLVTSMVRKASAPK